MKRLLMLLVLFAASKGLIAQTTVKGTVLDDSTGLPLPGVSVILEGTTNGTQTGADGKFSLSVPATTKKPQITVTSLSYTSQTVNAANAANLTIRLKKSQSTLDDVVVIGYGTSRRKDLTGAISSLPGKVLETIPVANAAEALTGRIPGVMVTSTDGAPGAEVVIRVRGGGSVTQDNSPLFIVDGFPVDNINDIATTDIESFDVLKDASASAIYGSRGANGVIIVTTKRAKAGKAVVSYNGFAQARAFPRKLKVLSPYEFVLAQYEYARLRSQSDVDNFSKFFGVFGDLELYKAQKGTDWQEELFGDPPVSTQHNISVAGGTDKTKINLSFTNNKDEGLMTGSSYERNYLSFKLNQEISKSIKLDAGVRYSKATTMGAGTAAGASVRINDAITTRPVNGLADQIVPDEISADQGDDYEQFLKSLIAPPKVAEQDYRRRIANTLNLSAALTWQIMKGLSFRTDFNIDRMQEEVRRYYGPLTGESRNVGGNLPLGEITDNSKDGYRWSNTLTYNFKTGNDHTFTVMGGHEMIDAKGMVKFMRAKYFAENLQPEKLFSNFSLGTVDRLSSNDLVGNSLMSFFGRANYSYKGKYLASLTFRADGSSLFAQGNQWGYFPSVSVAWRLSEEDFLKDVNFVNDLKLRLSYGEAGNNRIGINNFKETYMISDVRTIGFGDVANPYYTFTAAELPNPTLRWETTVTRNAGLDFTLFGNAVTGSLDVYWNTTKDLLVKEPIPQLTGFSSQWVNIGQTSNKGIELGLNANLINKKDFTLTGSFNIGSNTARIDALGAATQMSVNSNWASTDLKAQDDFRVIVGQTVGLMYGYVTDGFYTSDDFASYNPANGSYTLKDKIANAAAVSGGISIRPGVLKLKDLNGDGVISPDKDRQIIGQALPKFQGGFGLNTTYKGLDASVFFNFVYGNDVYNTGKISLNMLYRTTYGNMLNTVNSNDRYKYIDANGVLVTDLQKLAELNKDAKIWSPFSMGTASPVFHSWAVEDGSFLRLNNITIGYSLPKSLISKVAMTRFRVYATVYNAFLWTKYTGYDPEVSANRNTGYNALTPGVDYSGYPKSRSYTVGLNITF
ncbi:TonB-dependent receptor [Paraflavitalea sp. CAU 1676]|uniref:SusC/RagA family TonB-linked outer membrane protein n=1 Tax=Paraflavitalea sp. CAU 1676 TaxID=3032598 RepID=UPI0023DC1582|nr:TonB-dependent receptor [Paraflavitalea sp. CAU 1676]MDF2189555.1 TonB-dependent receptor [Paraflavitalea sp. CAU 1676]